MSYDTLLGKMILSGKIECITGLHIGGMNTGIEIGGLDNPVIKDPITDQPYIPGSSLKGKLRTLAEWSLGLVTEKVDRKGRKTYPPYDCSELGKPKPAEPKLLARWEKAYSLGRLFGPATDDHEIRQTAGPTRLIVRDARATSITLKDWESSLGENIYTEIKTENAIDRVTSEANPRPIERVPAGSCFDCSMIIDIYQKEDFDLFKLLFTSMHLLEQSTLGGAGSRGSGQVQFLDTSLTWRPAAYYKTGAGHQIIPIQGKEIVDIAKEDIVWPQI
jgi:CRISPR-associated protein Csm3